MAGETRGMAFFALLLANCGNQALVIAGDSNVRLRAAPAHHSYSPTLLPPLNNNMQEEHPVLNAIDSIVPQRHWAWSICIILCAVCVLLSAVSFWWTWPALAFGFLALVGFTDYTQERQAIRRNYPVPAHSPTKKRRTFWHGHDTGILCLLPPLPGEGASWRTCAPDRTDETETG